MSDLRRVLVAFSVLLLGPGTVLVGTTAPAAAGVEPDLVMTTDADELYVFNHATPTDVDVVPVVGLDEGDHVRGIALRPSNQTLYVLVQLADGSLAVATVDHHTGVLGALVALVDAGDDPVLLGSVFAFGLDFDPVADLLRVVAEESESHPNFTVDVDAGLTTFETDLNRGDQGQMPFVTAAAYTNSTVPAPTDTELFVIGLGEGDAVWRVDPASDGFLEGVSFLPDVTGDGGFEIMPNGAAFAALREVDPAEDQVPAGLEQITNELGLHARPKGSLPATLKLFAVSVQDGGSATLVGLIGDGSAFPTSLTDLPAPVPVTTTTTTTTLATTTSTTLAPAVSPTTLVRTGDDQSSRRTVGVLLLVAGGAGFVAAAKVRRRPA